MNIVLMRSTVDSKADPYYNALKTSANNVTSIPVLADRFINSEELECQVFSSNSFSGIIFTSKRAVEAVADCCAAGLPAGWRERPCFVVGDATKAAASKLGFPCVGHQSGNADNLAQMIILSKVIFPRGVPLLFVCGKQRRDELPNALTQNDVPLKIIEAYEVTEDPALSSNINTYLREHSVPSHIVYFSPSGYKFAGVVWKQLLDKAIEKVQMVAIGPTTGSVIQKDGFKVLMASKPTPDNLVQTVRTGLPNS
ncbi:uroporphyrinogen-III synthase-like isoform X1 [Clavelina lepadiformis]|uniref:uroporphyrinogen-III synthase-like isoform X1 n=1 Tax=Clavelina lepadiformis TaxID=159417 RepID=UPI0040413A4F